MYENTNADNTQKKPIISIIIAVYNGEKTFQRCIDSIAGQNFTNIELIVMDGGSDDGTRDILRKNSHTIAYWESEADRGICHAWNKALKHARGEWICFLGADDFFWQNDVLTRAAEKLAGAYPPYRLAYGQICIVKPDGTILEKKGSPWNRRHFLQTQTMIIPHQASFHHRSLFEIHGGFDETFRITGDYEFLLREAVTHGQALFLNDLLVSGMQSHGLSSQPEYRLLFLRENMKARQKNNIPISGFSWFFCVLRSYLRLLLLIIFGRKASDYAADIYRVCTGKPRLWT